MQIEMLIRSTEKLSRYFISVTITGFAEGSIIVMSEITVKGDATLTAKEVKKDIERALSGNTNSGLGVDPGSLSVKQGMYLLV